MRPSRLLGTVVALCLIGILALPRAVRASDYASNVDFGIGLFIGEPVGLSLKWMLGAGHAIQGTIAFELEHHDKFVLVADYLWHPNVITSASAFDLAWHFGVGGVLGIWYDEHHYHCHDVNPEPHVTDWECDEDTYVRAGARIPVGLDMLFKGAPVELSIEVAPALEFFPELVDFFIYGGLAARYFF